MNLILMSKNRGRRQKMPKTKIVRKDAYMRLLKAKGFCTEPQKGVLSLYFDSFYLFIYLFIYTLFKVDLHITLQ